MTNQNGFVAGLNDAVRENPVAAALVGAGVFWMLFGSKVPALASAVPDAAKSVGQSLSSAGQAASEVASDAAGSIKRQVSDAVNRTTDAAREITGATMGGSSDAISKTISDTGDKMAEIARETMQTGQQYANAVQQRLAEGLERQPLLLGALGIAIGAGIASAFPSTALESELMGKQGTAAREKLETLAEEGKSFAMKRGREVLDDVKGEAAAQGLMPDQAKQSLREFSAKAKSVAGAARESVAKRVS
jgi:hypothetical protein